MLFFSQLRTYPADYNLNADDAYLDETICDCSTTTRGEAMLMCLTLGMRHNLSWIAICDILKMINTVTTRDSVPTTQYKLMKYFSTQKSGFKYHLYCPDCGKYLGDRSNAADQQMISCPTCRSNFKMNEMTSFFLTMNFRSQVVNLLNNPEVVKSLRQRFNRRKSSHDVLEDIYDGIMYKKMSAPGEILENEFNLSYTFNTDGCQAANSSKFTIWPIYVMINEFPQELRAKHMLLVGIWVAKNEPNMNVFLQPFVDEANDLSEKGVEWRLPGGEMVTSKVVPLCCCVDSIARPAMLNMKQFNGFYGCTFCEHPTENVDGQRKYTVSTDIPSDRSDESIRRNMIHAHSLVGRQAVKGVWGPSCLMNLKHFDMADGMVPDDLHAGFSGAGKQHTELLLSSPGEEYYIGDPNTLAIVNDRLLSIRPPNCITRTPRSLTVRRLWKASEWRSWIVWYSLICIDGLLPRKYVQHLALLVTAITIFLQDSISPAMLDYAHESLVRYVVQFQELFGKQAMTFNVHLLLHFTKGVANWGPLWTHTAFPFENANRLLLAMKTSPTHVAYQIARRFILYKSLSTASEHISVSGRVKHFCKNLTENRIKFFNRVQGAVLIGKGKSRVLSAQEKALISRNIIDCRSYEKVICNNTRYTTESYQRCKKTNNSVIITECGLYGIISSICEVTMGCGTRSVLLFIREIEVGNPYISNEFVRVSHIKRCRISSELSHAISPTTVKGPGILFNIADSYFVSSIPRGCLHD